MTIPPKISAFIEKYGMILALVAGFFIYQHFNKPEGPTPEPDKGLVKAAKHYKDTLWSVYNEAADEVESGTLTTKQELLKYIKSHGIDPLGTLIDKQTDSGYDKKDEEKWTITNPDLISEKLREVSKGLKK